MDTHRVRQLLDHERSRLVRLERGLSQDLTGQSEKESVSELNEVDQHAAELGSETFEREKDLSVLQQIESQLDDVDRALTRLEDGTYGKCEVCGTPISDHRLEVVPATRLCREHEVEAEGPAQLH